MNNTRCFENGHIKNEAFILLDNEELDADIRLELCCHLASCDICAESYANFLTADLQIDIPTNLNENIIARTLPCSIVKQKITAIQFFKLTAAAVLTISLYSMGVFNSIFNISSNISNNIPQKNQILQFGNVGFEEKFNQGFSEFSRKINNFNGVDLNEKK